jgi:hypothetical protein
MRLQFPIKTSRYMFHVKVEEQLRGGLSSGESHAVSPLRVKPWGNIKGQIVVDLSDTGKLALRRFCGESINEIDVDLPDTSNIRLLTVHEIKRLHSLWTTGQAAQGASSDPSSLFRAVIRPLDHLPGPSIPYELRRSFFPGWLRRSISQAVSANTDASSRSDMDSVVSNLTTSDDLDSVTGVKRYIDATETGTADRVPISASGFAPVKSFSLDQAGVTTPGAKADNARGSEIISALGAGNHIASTSGGVQPLLTDSAPLSPLLRSSALESAILPS